jgi:hypothetical protein
MEKPLLNSRIEWDRGSSLGLVNTGNMEDTGFGQ